MQDDFGTVYFDEVRCALRSTMVCLDGVDRDKLS